MKKVLGALILAACATSAHADWDYKQTTDPMTSKVTKTAVTTSANSLNLGFPYKGDNYGRLLVRNKGGSLNVMFSIDKGQIICHDPNMSFHECRVQVRFDEAQPITFTATGSDDHSSNVLFFNSETKFVELARKAKKIRVAVTIYQSGTAVLEFDTPASLVWDAAQAKPVSVRIAQREKLAVQLGVFSTEDSAQNVLQKMREGGFPVYTEKIPIKNGSAVRVRLGPFDSKEKAEAMLERVKKLGVDGKLVPLG